jgi:isoleucyl-tRNA synthetase
MNQDKSSGYMTLFTVLNHYLKLCAPFAPFITEHIFLDMQQFRKDK